ncbi:MAG: iron-containing alcohol dehydrogenase [Pseudomonadota bacterium]
MTPTTADLLAPQDWSFPIPIHYGPGRVREIAGRCRAAGMSRPLVVTDRGTAALPFIERIVGLLEADGLACQLYAGFSPNPRDDEVGAGRDLFRAGGHDGVVAVGGGSGMDGGKAVATVANNDFDLWAFEFEQTSPAIGPDQAFPPLITIPTTAGTGAETESTAMVTETRRMMKFCTWHPQFSPTAAILDPELTVGLPASMTAWTGCDALVHAVEGFCVPGFHPLCDGAALEGLRLINRWLRRAVAEPTDLEARGGMLVGSCLAGISFLKGLGLVHAISHMVGAEFDTQHGLTNAVTLPAVLRFNEPAIAHEIQPLAEAMGLEDTSFDSFYAANCALLDDLDIPRTLADIGVLPNRTMPLAEKAIVDSAAGTNARIATVDEIAAVIDDVLTFGR